MKEKDDTKMILSLIERIGSKLPCKSGKKLETIEADSLIQHMVNAIVDLSRFKLGTIAHSLTQLLENISKSTPTAYEELPSVDVLQSQLFILKVLSACMTHHWKCHRIELLPRMVPENSIEESSANSLNPPNSSDSNPSNSSNPPSPSNSSPLNPSSPSISLNSNFSNQTNPSKPNSSSPSFKLPKSWDDPPPLEDNLAKYILLVLSRFLYQMASQEDYDLNIPGVQTGVKEPSMHGIHTTWSPAIYELVSEIFKSAGRVIFYISASNWNVVFTRIKHRIAHLSSVNDDWPDTSELKLLECSDLNSKRLSMVLQELCNSFMNLKKYTQMSMAVVLRKAIWNWIEVFPAEFVRLCQSQKKMEGGPELLFDICNNIANNNRQKSLFWPLQTMLLILCPDILMNAVTLDRTSNKSVNRKIQFFENLKKSLKGKQLAEVAAVCYVDIFKASTYVAKNETSALRMIVPEIENELKEKLFDPNKPFPNEQNVDQKKLMTDCLTALFRINPENTLRTLIPICVREDAPNSFKLVLVKSCYSIATEDLRLPGSPKISTMYSYLAVPLRKLFQDLINFRTTSFDTSRRNRKSIEEYQERTEIILNILKLYRTEPHLAIVERNTNEQIIDNQSIILGIMKCLNDNNYIIRTTAAETLLELHTPNLIELWGIGENKMQHFWYIRYRYNLFSYKSYNI